MLNVIGFGRRLVEIADLKLRARAERYAVETVRTLGVEARFRCTSDKELARLRSLGGEPVIMHFIERLQPGDCYYDIGANTGFYAILAGHRVGRNGCVVAFEPENKNFSQLRANARLNRLAQFIACPFGLSDRNGAGILRLQSDVAGEGAHALVDAPAEDTVTVFLLPLDLVIEQFKLPTPTHIKIDVEGHEESVLAGAGATLASPQLRGVAVEAHFYRQLADHREYDDDAALEAKRSRIVEAMRGSGLTLETDLVTREGEVRFAHMLFVRR